MRLVFILIAAVTTGCAIPNAVELPTIAEKVGRVPELKETASVPVGGTVYSQFRYWSKVGYRLSDPVNVGFMLGRVSSSSGDFVAKAMANGKPAFCTEKLAYFDPLMGPRSTACFLDSTQSGYFSGVLAAPNMVWLEKDLPSRIRYESSEQIIPRSDAFRYEILFQGLSNRTLRFAYREFTGDFARPAFFQDVTYELTSLPMQVAFRSVQFEILEAGNNGIKYRVLSGF